MKSRLLTLAIERPRLVYGVILLITLVMGAQIPRIEIDTDPENMLPESADARVYHQAVKQRFDLHDAIVVGAVNDTNPSGIYTPASLAALNQLTQAIARLDGVVSQDLMALGVVDNISQEGPGTIRFSWLMKDAPTTQAQAQAVREAVERLPMLHNTLVSGDGKAAAIYVPLTSKDLSYPVAETIRALFTDLPGDDRYFVTGLPVAEDQFGFEMFVQMGISAPLAGVMIFLLMALFFRNLALVTAPMLVAMATVIITMGALIGLGFKVHIMSSMIAIFLMPIAVVDSIHILSEFADRFRPGDSPRAVIRQVLEHLFTPMLFTSITSMVGFLSLMLTPIPPVQIFGAFVGLGILLAFILTITLVPAYIVRMSPASLQALQQQHQRPASRLSRLLPRLGRLAQQRGRALIGIILALFALSVAGLAQIQINDNPIRWFKADHEIRVADRVLNTHFAGTYDAYLVLESPDPQPELERLHSTLLDTLSRARSAGVSLKLPAPDAESAHQPLAYLENLALLLDDQLFEANATQQPVLEELLAQVEQAQRTLKRFLSPELLRYMARLQQSLEASGLVGKSSALPQLVKTVSRELQGGTSTHYEIPDSAAAVAQTLLQYQSSHRPQDLWHFVTPDYRSALLWLQLTSGDNQDMTRVVNWVEAFVAEHPLPDGLSAHWAGKAYLNVIWQDAMVNGMLDSLLSAFVIVFIMMTLLFRSLIFGLLAMLPLTVTITFIYGLIGWLGKDYDMPIAVLSALTLGLSVDFAIHFLERVRALTRQLGSLSAALNAMFEEPARAITRNALVIALGFTPLLFAPLVPYITVGTFLASIMAFSALITLLLLPALLIRFRKQAFGRAADTSLEVQHG